MNGFIFYFAFTFRRRIRVFLYYIIDIILILANEKFPLTDFKYKYTGMISI